MVVWGEMRWGGSLEGCPPNGREEHRALVADTAVAALEPTVRNMQAYDPRRRCRGPVYVACRRMM